MLLWATNGWAYPPPASPLRCLPAGKMCHLFNYELEKRSLESLLCRRTIELADLIGGWLLADPTRCHFLIYGFNYFSSLEIKQQGGLMPAAIFNWEALLSVKGFLLIIVGGFLVGFGTRYAQGCTSGHGIFGCLLSMAILGGHGILLSWRHIIFSFCTSPDPCLMKNPGYLFVGIVFGLALTKGEAVSWYAFRKCSDSKAFTCSGFL